MITPCFNITHRITCRVHVMLQINVNILYMTETDRDQADLADELQVFVAGE